LKKLWGSCKERPSSLRISFAIS